MCQSEYKQNIRLKVRKPHRVFKKNKQFNNTNKHKQTVLFVIRLFVEKSINIYFYIIN